MIRKLVLATTLFAFAPACVPGQMMPPEEETGGSPGAGGKGGKGGGSGGKGGGTGGASETGGSGPAAGGSGGSGSGGSGSGGGGGSTQPDGGTDTGSPVADCAGELANTLVCKPTGPMPKTIKETGLFPSAPDFTKRPRSLIEFSPNPALWTDGLGKQRFLLLPEGKKIDNTERTKWEFPVGTVLIKTFFDDGAAGGKPRPVETRFIRRIGDLTKGDFTEYDYYTYQWNAAGTDAMLVMEDEKGDVKKTIPVMVTVNRMVDGQPFTINGGQPFPHDLPSREMCGNCHTESGMQGGQTFIGFDEVRLNGKLTPTSAKTQLQEFADLGIFAKPIPSDPATITDPDPRLQRIKRAFFGNCVHCHMGGTVFDLRPNVLVENTVGKEVEAQSVKPPKGWLRVVPGNPDMSVVYRQILRINLPAPVMATDTRLRPMPPVGVADFMGKSAVDQPMVDDVKAWIMSLPPK